MKASMGRDLPWVKYNVVVRCRLPLAKDSDGSFQDNL